MNKLRNMYEFHVIILEISLSHFYLVMVDFVVVTLKK